MQLINARRQLGISRYGTELKTYNGRDALVDAFQEALDLAQYLAQALAEETEDTSEVQKSVVWLMQTWNTRTIRILSDLLFNKYDTK